MKRIPAAAGLGGGSSDAAAALVAANLGWNLGLSASELADAAAQLGSDVPFFLGGGPAICRGRGERSSPSAGWALGLRRGASAGRPGHGRRLRRLPAGRAAAARGARWWRRSAAEMSAAAGRAAVEPLAAGRRTAVALDRAAARGVCGPGLSGAWNEWKRNIVLWALPSRPPGTAAGATFTGNRHRKRLCRAKLPLKFAGMRRRPASKETGRGNHRGSRQAHGGAGRTAPGFLLDHL